MVTALPLRASGAGSGNKNFSLKAIMPVSDLTLDKLILQEAARGNY